MKTVIIKLQDMQELTDLKNNIEDLGGETEYISPVLPIISVSYKVSIDVEIKKRYNVSYIIPAPEDGLLLDGTLLGNGSLRIFPNIDEHKLRAKSLTGWGATVVIIDSGISIDGVTEHSDFTGYGSAPVIDHGDKVASVFKKFARGAKLISCKATHTHKVKLFDVLRAIDFAISKNVNIINLSLGFDIPSCSSGQCPICDVVEYYSLNKNVLFIAAAGNKGVEGSVQCPGNCQEVVTVSAINSLGTTVADYCSKGAPGAKKPNIITTGEVIYNGIRDSGTSFAAPVVTGVSATLITQLNYNNASLKSLLFSTAIDMGLPEHYQGFGKLNLDGILEALYHDQDSTESQGQE
ncbi:MAG: S8 family serine peptidase [Clostridium sp.]|nr:S8 family serine peptidase [Clostridium sp.]